MLVNDEVGDGRLDLQGRRLGDGAAANVDLRSAVVGMGHVADLLGLRQPAAQADIGLDDIDGALLKEIAVAPAGVNALAGGDGDVDGVAHLDHVLHVEGMAGLLIVEDAQVLQRMADLNGGRGISVGVHLNDDIQVLSTDLAHSSYTVVHRPDHTVLQRTGDLPGLALFAGDHDGVHLNGIIALRHGHTGDLRVLFGLHQTLLGEVGPPVVLELAGISTEIIVHLSAQQRVDGHAQRLALDIPQGNVDATDTCVDHGASAHAPEGLAENGLPNLLIVHGVHTDDLLGKILHHAEPGAPALAVGQTYLPESADPLIGIHPDDDRTPSAAGGPCVSTGDLHDIYADDFHNLFLRFKFDQLLLVILVYRFIVLISLSVAEPRGLRHSRRRLSWMRRRAEMSGHPPGPDTPSPSADGRA